MKKNGFALIETIVTLIILTASLLYLYSTYSAILNEEEIRLRYDDPSYIYYTNNVRKFLEEYSNIELIKNNAFTNSYIVTIGTGYEGLFSELEKNMAEKIVESYNINQILLIDTKLFSECISSSKEGICSSSYENVGYNLKSYINTLSTNSNDYYLVIEYSFKQNDGKIEKCTPGLDEACKSYYASLGV